MTTREIKVIQNYMNKQEPLNDPKNKECLETVLKILQGIVSESNIENLDIKVANFLRENFGIQLDIDPYGKNTGIELNSSDMMQMKDCKNPKFKANGEYAEFVDGLWNKNTDELDGGLISIDNLNAILEVETMNDDDIKGLQVKKDGRIAKITMDLN